MTNKLEMLYCINCRHFGTKNFKRTLETLTKTSLNTKWKYKLDETVENGVEENVLKPRYHPGIMKPKTIKMPDSFVKAVQNTFEDQDIPKKQIVEKTDKFVRYLHEKKPPIEEDELKDLVGKLKEKVTEKLAQKRADLLNDKYVIKSQLNDQLKKKVYNWTPVKYDILNSLLYLVGRSAAEYSVLVKIFSEIKSRDPDWKPRSLIDFGSGVGTVTWAANLLWPKNILEYFNVDVSSEMNELAEHLLKGGRGEKTSPLRGVYYRQFLPATPTPYDLTVSAYTLMELPSLQSRLETIKNLWCKTTKYLVVVEQGTFAGYKVINEVRDFILLEDGHVFSPCPHDNVCPRYMMNDGTPCNFETKYYSMPLSGPSQVNRERYSYIVLKKGPRGDEDPQWPRLVRPTLLRHKHVVCNLCTIEGKIEQAVFTASKYGKPSYRCAKASDWGDRLPVNIKKGCETVEKLEEDELKGSNV